MKRDWRAEYVLPEDVAIVSVRSLPPGQREQVADADDDYIIQRAGNREGAKAIDAPGARLLEAFRQPRRIVDVVVALSRSLDTPAEPLLEECLPLIRAMVNGKFLTVAGSVDAQPKQPLLAPGAMVRGWRVLECIRLVDDSEIYRVEREGVRAALKRLRPAGVEQGLGPLLRREAAILARLAGGFVPTLLDADLEGELPWIALSWVEGRSPDRFADERERLQACLAIAEAYGALHRQGVLHGDVHPANILIGGDGRAFLLDFGLARVPGDPELDAIFRGAVSGYWEPEYAAAALRGEPSPPVSAAGEQYAVATLIDTLLTGVESLVLPPGAADQWHAVLEGERRCFADRGRLAWPAIERVLRRGTAREPEQRYPEVADFAAALRAAAARPRAVVARAADPVGEFLRAALPGGELFTHGLSCPPRSSINFGAAGVAFALYRIARARDDGEMLAAAEVWQCRAEAGLEEPGGLQDEHEFRSADLGDVSPYHSGGGVWLTSALIHRAAGSGDRVDRAIALFLAATARAETKELDLTLGHAGALLAAALLYEISPARPLRAYGDGLLQRIWDELRAEPSIREGRKIGYLGIAHGWAGYLYATLAWAKATATPPPPPALERLAELRELAAPGKGRLMPITVPGHPLGRGMVTSMDGWCHGQAGHAFLELLAGQTLGDPAALARAAEFGERAFRGEERIGNLCCGLAGRGYALLALHRATDDKRWLKRARQLTEHARTGSACDHWPNSLYKGRVGLAVFAAEAENPANASMPIFEFER